MIGTPLSHPCAPDSRVSGTVRGRLRAFGAPALSCSERTTTRSYAIEFRQVVGGTFSLPLHRQK